MALLPIPPCPRAPAARTLGALTTTLALAVLASGCLVDRSALASREDAAGPLSGLDAQPFDAPGSDAARLDADRDAASGTGEDTAGMDLDAFVAMAEDTATPDAPSPRDAGSDAPSRRDAGSDAPSSVVVIRRVQDANAEGTNPTATFPSEPREGNFLVAIAFHRLDDASATIEGWDRRLYDFYSTGNGNRRGLAFFTRVAGPAEPTVVPLVWSPDRESRLLVQEFEASVPGVWSFEQAGSDDSGDTTVASLEVTTSDTPEGMLLVVAGLGARDEPGMVAFAGLGETINLGGPRSLSSAHGTVTGGDPISVDLSWPTARRATAGVIAVRFTPD